MHLRDLPGRTPAEPRDRSRLRAPVAIFLAFALLVAACGGSGDDEESSNTTDRTTSDEDPTRGGRVIFGLEDEPATLNMFTTAGFGQATQIVTGPVLAQLTVLTPDGEYVPDLLAEPAALTSEAPQKARDKLRADAVWEDGSQITAEDVQFTLDQILTGRNDVVDRSGYNLIKDGALSEVSDDGKEFTLEFTQEYAPWRTLFSAGAPILKKAAMDGVDFNNAFNDGIPFASGPFKVESWTKGQEIVLVRNDEYWGDHTVYLDRLVFRFVASKELMAQTLANGEIDVAYQITQPEIVDLVRDQPGIDLQITAGPIWEHIDFNMRDTLLQLKEVREAVVRAIDRNQIVDQVVRPIDGDAVVLQNVFYMNNQSEYRENWDEYVRDLTQVDELLAAAGFTKGPDGIYARGANKLSLSLLTTQGNPQRLETGELLKAQLLSAGIDLVIEEVPTEELLDRVANCEYEIALFAYQADPDPASANQIYRADSISCPGEDQNIEGENSTAYRNVEVTELLDRTDGQLDEARRVRLYQEIDKLIARDAPTLPVYQRSTVLAYNSAIRNVIGNATLQGPTWNAGEWWFKRETPATPAPTPEAEETTTTTTPAEPPAS